MRHAIAAMMLVILTGCNPAQDSGKPAAESSASPPTTIPAVPQSGATANGQNPEPTVEECGADRLARYLNVLPTESMKAEIAETAGHDRIRYIEAGDMVTQDFRPDRLNVETGQDGRIKLFRCG